jgi:serine/threonine protein kinase
MKISPHRYEVVGTIGTGATSRVDKARDAMIGRTVALKTFLHNFGSEDLQMQFLREAQIIGRLTHPNIVALHDVGVNPEGLPYLVMEYVDGKTLESTLSAGALPLERAVVWGMDLAAALARAQQCNIIHGDVKPANVLITKDGQVKLGDFGIARFATQMSGSGTLMGTPAYLSPEQIQGQKQDARSDLFSLGIILYQMTTGLRPFSGTSVSAVCAQIVSANPAPPSYHNPALPPEFDHVVMRCLAKNPADRYASAEALSASLFPFAAGRSAVAMPTRPRSWWQRPWQAQDVRAAAAVMAALGVLGVGARALVDHKNVGAHSTQTPGNLVVAPAPVNATSDSSTGSPLANQPSASMINISGSGLASAEWLPHASNSGANSATGFASPELDGTTDFSASLAPQTSPGAFARHVVSTANPKSLHSSDGSSPAKTSSAGSLTARGDSPASGDASTRSAAVSRTLLHVDVLANVSDQTLSVYSGDQLLLSTPLKPSHIGDTLRFDCSVEPGEHAFRVVLSRPDDSVLLEKGNTSEIRPDGSNFLGIHVTKHQKMLVRHEVGLEVVWPSTDAPVASAATKPVGELASR